MIVKEDHNLRNLRVMAMMMVIILHIAAAPIIKYVTIGGTSFEVANVYDSFVRIGVPLFVLISGAFNLNILRNIELKYFYNKMIRKVLIPTFVFSFLISLGAIIYNVVLRLQSGTGLTIGDLFIPLLAWFSGRPLYHLWYMYMVIGLYALTPFLLKLMQKYPLTLLTKVAFGLVGFGFILNLTSRLHWTLEWGIYLGYYFLGGLLYRARLTKPQVGNSKMFILIAVGMGFLIMVSTSLMVRFQVNLAPYLQVDPLYFYEYTSPFVAVGAISLFYGFIHLPEGKPVFQSLGSYGFTIYLFHALMIGLTDIMYETFNLTFFLNEGVHLFYLIPLKSIIVFLLSWGCALILRWFFNLPKINEIYPALSEALKIR